MTSLYRTCMWVHSSVCAPAWNACARVQDLLFCRKHREGLEAPAWMHNPPQACCSNDTHPTTSMHINSGDEQAAVTNKQRRPARCTHTLSRSVCPQTMSVQGSFSAGWVSADT
eukprot:scaffold163652_cov15-Tisochrysis_lutea.AAC.1